MHVVPNISLAISCSQNQNENSKLLFNQQTSFKYLVISCFILKLYLYIHISLEEDLSDKNGMLIYKLTVYVSYYH